jgi:hypothetical protein
MFQSQVAFPVTLTLYGDVGDNTIHAWKAPFSGEVVNMWAGVGVTVEGAGTGILVALQNGGSIGTATTLLGSVYGGTAAGTSWIGTVCYSGTMAASTAFSAGDVLTIKYDETGTINPGWVNAGFNVRYGTS